MKKKFVHIRFAMFQAGLTQAELAAKLGIGTPTISKKLNGISDWTVTELQLMSKLFGVNIDELVA